MKKYETPEAEVIRFENEDILTNSIEDGGGGNIGWD
jgi:hypothetical protein